MKKLALIAATLLTVGSLSGAALANGPGDGNGNGNGNGNSGNFNGSYNGNDERHFIPGRPPSCFLWSILSVAVVVDSACSREAHLLRSHHPPNNRQIIAFALDIHTL